MGVLFEVRDTIDDMRATSPRRLRGLGRPWAVRSMGSASASEESEVAGVAGRDSTPRVRLIAKGTVRSGRLGKRYGLGILPRR